MRRRGYDEISDEEWAHHDFRPSRVLKRSNTTSDAPPKRLPPPPIESFAYRRNPTVAPAVDQKVIVLDDDEEGFCDDFADSPPRPVATRGSNRVRRRFIVDDDDENEHFGAGDVLQMEKERCLDELNDDDWLELLNEDDNKVAKYGREDEDEDDSEFLLEDARDDKEGVVDIVGKALRKCSRISASLKEELYGSSAWECDRYAETDASSCRIVTQEIVDEACSNDELDFKPTLKPYQLVGVNFLLLLHRKNIGGAILADEMGLGKTVQAVTYLSLLKHLHNDPGPHLIVCPASVLENWERELNKWCPYFSVIVFHGIDRTMYSKELSSKCKANTPPPFNVVLVCYSLFERRSAQQKDDRKMLRKWRWNCVLIDEAHQLKDKNSFRWRNLMSVAQSARQRLMLTGTPLQNDLHELWSLLEFMMPDIFASGTEDLKKLLNAEDRDLISRMKSILGPFILRRLKADVMQQLVPKIQDVKYVNMDSVQSEVYAGAVSEYRAICRARDTKLVGQSNNVMDLLPKRQISNYFMQFRKIANHPLLVRNVYGDEDVVQITKLLYPKGVFGFDCDIERAIQEMKSYNDFSIHKLLILYGNPGTKGALNEDHVLGSAKCRELAELLPLLAKDGHRVLIFSQWTSMLDILEWALEVIGVTFLRLDGSTPVTERQSIVDTYNNNSTIFACLLSTRAGGQGLNLVGADTVIIHDMDFNPQMDRQAEDRCHRIGQEKPVTVYRLVTKGTVDEDIYQIARRKLVLDAAVLESGAEMDNSDDVPEKTMGEILASMLLG